MKYLSWDEQTIADFSDANVASMYERGYVFTRKGKGVMQQTRSVRIDLAKFALSSENRRVLKKIEGISSQEKALPMAEYDYAIAKQAKDFYEAKFGPGIMSAQKAKELLSDGARSNFNALLEFEQAGKPLGFTICYEGPEIAHYSYPFYDLSAAPKDMGMGMMILAIEWAKQNDKAFIYLGSLQRPGDTYKLQFEGLEWFDGGKWRRDTEAVKALLADTAAQA